MTLAVGDLAPTFSLENQHGQAVSLADYAGQYVLVWWIPSTMAEQSKPCCDKIGQAFGAEVAKHPELNVVGLSFDTPIQMRVFATRALLSFPLLSDNTKAVGEAYGVRRGEGKDWDSFPMKRAFLVNPDGKIEKIYLNIDPDLFVPEVVADLAERMSVRT